MKTTPSLRVAIALSMFVISAGCANGGRDADEVPAGSAGGGGAGGSLDASAEADGAAGAAGADATTDAGDEAPLEAGGDAPSDAQVDAPAWPTCDAMPASAAAKAIVDVWADDPQAPAEVWIAGAYVTGISKGGCVDGQACQLFLQADPTYASLAAGAHHAIKLFASGPVSGHFVGLAVGDQVDVLGWAWRYTLGGQNELLVEVNTTLPGCAKKVGAAAVTPIAGVTLDLLTADAYENAVGPLLVEVAGVSGKPASSLGQTFGLWTTSFDGGFADAGAAIVSLSPFFLPGGAFTGLTPGVTTKFSSVAGVFGLFVPAVDAGLATKYLEVYPRTMADVAVAP